MFTSITVHIQIGALITRISESSIHGNRTFATIYLCESGFSSFDRDQNEIVEPIGHQIWYAHCFGPYDARFQSNNTKPQKT